MALNFDKRQFTKILLEQHCGKWKPARKIRVDHILNLDPRNQDSVNNYFSQIRTGNVKITKYVLLTCPFQKQELSVNADIGLTKILLSPEYHDCHEKLMQSYPTRKDSSRETFEWMLERHNIRIASISYSKFDEKSLIWTLENDVKHERSIELEQNSSRKTLLENNPKFKELYEKYLTCQRIINA
jgi:hypothetical protein